MAFWIHPEFGGSTETEELERRSFRTNRTFDYHAHSVKEDEGGMGGAVAAESEPGRGSRCTLSLPALPAFRT
jgi:hypothetical protein